MSWPLALVVSVALLVLGTLAFIGADTSDLVLILVSLLGGAGVEQLRGLRENTNGAQAALLAEVRETRRLLAAAPPPPAASDSPPPNGGGEQPTSGSSP